MLPHLIIYFCAFIGIWVGSGLAINSVEKISRELKVSTFAISFLILGLFSSISELSVGLNAVWIKDPEIFVGNLIGATIVLFMLVVPLLVITGKKINITPEFRGFNLMTAIVVVGLPVVLALDGIITRFDGLISIILYLILAISIESKKGLLEKIKEISPKTGFKMGKELIKILLGVVAIFLSSKLVVEQTLYFSILLNLSPFLLSLLLIGVGTNIPELTLVIRSVFKKNKQIALGNYVGSAAFNTFLFGLLTLLNNESVKLSNSYVVSIVFLIVGLLAFYYFSRTKNSLSRNEGLVLLMLYFLFIGSEIVLYIRP